MYLPHRIFSSAFKYRHAHYLKCFTNSMTLVHTGIKSHQDSTGSVICTVKKSMNQGRSSVGFSETTRKEASFARPEQCPFEPAVLALLVNEDRVSNLELKFGICRRWVWDNHTISAKKRIYIAWLQINCYACIQ